MSALHTAALPSWNLQLFPRIPFLYDRTVDHASNHAGNHFLPIHQLIFNSKRVLAIDEEIVEKSDAFNESDPVTVAGCYVPDVIRWNHFLQPRNVSRSIEFDEPSEYRFPSLWGVQIGLVEHKPLLRWDTVPSITNELGAMGQDFTKSTAVDRG